MIVYLLLINALAFLFMYADKQFAIHRKRRIPERTLLGIAALGGSLGAWLGMGLFRHKTRHGRFTIGVPLMLCMQLLLLLGFMWF